MSLGSPWRVATRRQLSSSASFMTTFMFFKWNYKEFYV